MGWPSALATILAVLNAAQWIVNRKMARAQRKLTEAQAKLAEEQAQLARAQAENVATETLRAVVDTLAERLGAFAGQRAEHVAWDDEMIEVVRDTGRAWRTPPPLL